MSPAQAGRFFTTSSTEKPLLGDSWTFFPLLFTLSTQGYGLALAPGACACDCRPSLTADVTYPWGFPLDFHSSVWPSGNPGLICAHYPKLNPSFIVSSRPSAPWLLGSWLFVGTASNSQQDTVQNKCTQQNAACAEHLQCACPSLLGS